MATFVIQYEYDDRADVRDAVRPAHRAFLGDLLERGLLLASGPWTDAGTSSAQASGPAATNPAGALLVVRADSAEAALTLLDDDPFWTGCLITDRSARGWDPVLGPWSS